MDATSQRDQVIQLLRVVGHRQQPERQYEVLTVDGQRLLVAWLPVLALRFIALRDVVVLFWAWNEEQFED